MRKILLTMVCGVVLLAGPVVTRGAIVTVPTDLNIGDTYRLVFVTLATRNGQSANIQDYNNFVTAVAESEPALAALGTTWTAIASTFSMFARDNTGTGASHGSGFPIYRLDNLRVASNYADLWDGSILNPIQVTEGGLLAPVTTGPLGDVWTGTGAQGAWNYALGFSGASAGTASATDWRWITDHPFPPVDTQFTWMTSKNLHFYAMSGLLTVPTPVPEPSSFLICGIGIFGMRALVRQRRKRQNILGAESFLLGAIPANAETTLSRG